MVRSHKPRRKKSRKGQVSIFDIADEDISMNTCRVNISWFTDNE